MPDITIEAEASVPVLIGTSDLLIDSIVSLRVVLKFEMSFTVNATHISGDCAQSTWQANVNLSQTYPALQVRAIGS